MTTKRFEGWTDAEVAHVAVLMRRVSMDELRARQTHDPESVEAHVSIDIDIVTEWRTRRGRVGDNA